MWLFALYEGRRTPLHAVLGPVETRLLQARRDRPQGRAELAPLRGAHADVQLRAAAASPMSSCGSRTLLPLNPRGYRRRRPGRRVQHRDQLHHQHQLADAMRANRRCRTFSQMLGLTIHNFLSAATGIALAFALFRGFARREATTHRQFLGRHDARHALSAAADLHRLCALPDRERRAADASPARSTRPRSKASSRRIALGPVASQEAIKMLGTNGGGFFNANSRASVREPDRAHQPRPDAVDLRDRRRADLDASARRSATPARAGRSSPR